MMKSFKNRILNLIYPQNIKCMFCRDELNENSHNTTCEACLKTLPFIQNPCPRCGSEMEPEERGICHICYSRKFYFTQAKSVFVYRGLPLQVVHNLKYNNRKFLAEYMAQYLLEAYGAWNFFADFVTCVSMFLKREKQRGYNQAKLLAKEFSKCSKVPFVEFCDKIVDTQSQTELDTQQRIDNVAGSFKLKPEHKKLIKNKTILVIDDVVTTGATSNEVCKMLIKGGAKECFVLSFAHTSINNDE